MLYALMGPERVQSFRIRMEMRVKAMKLYFIFPYINGWLGF